LEISRAAYYYQPCAETEENLALMRRLDELHLEHPVYGSRRLTVMLRREGKAVNRKRVSRLLGLMGIEAIYPRRLLSQPGEGHEIFPYLLCQRALKTGQGWADQNRPPEVIIARCAAAAAQGRDEGVLACRTARRHEREHQGWSALAERCSLWQVGVRRILSRR
jgi:hypothetical protein